MASKIKSLEAVDGIKFTDGVAQLGAIGVNGNQRKKFDEAKMAELVESVRRQGIINPITVRDAVGGENHDDGSVTLVLVAGARRLRAAKEAGLKEVPIRRVLDATPEQCEQIQAVENLQRADLTPIEEARCYVKLIGENVLYFTDEQFQDVALRVGKPVAHVRRTVALLELAPGLLEKIESGELQLAIAHQILRVPEKYRESLAKFATTKTDWQKRLPTLDEVMTQIERTVERDLKHAWFPKDVDNYGGTGLPECGGCPFNTGNQGSLFDGAQEGACVNPGCYSKRTATYLDGLKDQGAARWPGVKFAGVGTMGWEKDHQIAGAGVVDHTEKKIKKLLEDRPDAFAFGILKPRSQDTAKKPRLALVLLDPKVLPAKEQPKVEHRTKQDPRARAKEQYISDRTQVALTAAAVKVLKKRTPALLLQLAQEAAGELGAGGEVFGITEDMGDKEIAKAVAKLDAADRILVLWVAKSSDWEFETALRKQDVATKPVIVAAEKEAGAEFEKRNALRCRVCACSTDVACRLKKPGGESYDTVPCAWHDPKSETPTCTAHAKPKEKTDAKNK